MHIYIFICVCVCVCVCVYTRDVCIHFKKEFFKLMCMFYVAFYVDICNHTVITLDLWSKQHSLVVKS